MGSPPLWIVIPAALAGAAGFGLAGALQHTATIRAQARPALRPGLVRDLIQQPLWVTSLLATVVGSALQLVALANGPVAMVQPLLVTGLLFAVLFRSLLARHRPRAYTMLGAGLCAIGLAGFLVVARPPGGAATLSLTDALPLAGGLAVALIGCLSVAFHRARAALDPCRLLSLVACCTGSARVWRRSRRGLFSPRVSAHSSSIGRCTRWPSSARAASSLTQHAYRAHPILAPAQAVITLTDPLVGVSIGVLWLHERLQAGVADVVGEVLALATMACGVWMLAHHTPDFPRPEPRAHPLGEQ